MIRPVAVTGAAVFALSLASPAHATPPVDYVALGDSAAAGPLIPVQDPSAPGCFRSLVNYPALTAKALKVRSFRDVTCSSAKTAHLTSPQQTPLGEVPAQYAALSRGTDLVSLHIGANDISLTRMITDCLASSPAAKSCKDAYFAETGKDPWKPKIRALVPVLRKAIDGIRARSPHARIYVAGYTTYLPRGGCHPRVPILPRDATYIQQTINRLNAAIAHAARSRGAHYVDLARPARHHTVCASPRVRWVEPYVPANPAVPFHPNATGMRAFAAILVAELKHSRRTPTA
ncbi:SGNH/GDSL hydrolase family protein [Actinocorallia sp. API 0066]|uniref:SGNH/GDSL hydrolase family protein n=1 Tax=Actinocorallia sp. API 0066 TaxID=2896846 RepID=UPI001E5CBAF1|nr:SGNH/GDSL hydrolase family protein [Actinocorallia sp. API 0066]MCD0449164.1 SGNH/GDSL hydrolase family protein [Actinocorallia sp. API 0066]